MNRVSLLARSEGACCRIIRCLLLLLAGAAGAHGEGAEPDWSLQAATFGEPVPAPQECLSAEQSAMLRARAAASMDALVASGIALPKGEVACLFEWPVRPVGELSGHVAYAITNFVDHDSDSPESLRDYNCGARTYDLANGYDHDGTDIASVVHPWRRMRLDQLLAVAACDGVIVHKEDGHFDRNCGFNSLPANVVILQHGNGVRSVYAHLKEGSVTSKPTGALVIAGEALGVVASSGSSSGPHLHFEVWDEDDSIIDPFEGSCGSAASMWREQPPYYDPAILHVATSTQAPVHPPCPTEEPWTERQVFALGERTYFTCYGRDALPGDIIEFRLTRPDGSTEFSSTGTFPGYVSRYSPYWSGAVPSPGAWRVTFSVTGLPPVTRKFFVCPAGGIGEDGDADGTPDSCDPCPLTPSSLQSDSDGDGLGDDCDACPHVQDTALQVDTDGDGWGDACDGCVLFADPGQDDSNHDGASDACDLTWGDVAPAAAPDGVVDIADVSRVLSFTVATEIASVEDSRRADVAPASFASGSPETATPTARSPASINVMDVVLLLRVVAGLTQLSSPY